MTKLTEAEAKLSLQEASHKTKVKEYEDEIQKMKKSGVKAGRLFNRFRSCVHMYLGLPQYFPSRRVATILENLENLGKYLFFLAISGKTWKTPRKIDVFPRTQGKLKEKFFTCTNKI